MSTGLGGWQRVGIVVSTGWTLFVAFIVWNNGPVLSDFTPLYWLPDQPAEVLARFNSQRSQMMGFGLLLWLMPPSQSGSYAGGCIKDSGSSVRVLPKL